MKSMGMNNVVSIYNKRESFYRSLYPIILVLKVLGAYPMVKVKNGSLTAIVFSWNTLYFIFVIVFYFSLLSLFMLFAPSTENNTFSSQVWEILRMYALILVVVTPLTIWTASGNITNYFNNWMTFESHFQVTTGNVLCFSLYKKCFTWIFLLLGLHLTKQIAFICTDNKKTSTEFKIIYTIAFCLTMAMRDTLCLYWFAICTALTIAANKTSSAFLQDFRSTRIPVHTVTRYRSLWMDLCKLARQLGEAHCYTYCFYILYGFLVITLMVYNSIFMFIRGDFSRVWLYPTEISCISLGLLTFCSAANEATDKIKNKFSPHLLVISATSFNTDVVKETKLFLKAIEHFAPVISLKQYVTVNKSLIVSLTVTLVTYLIVLVQFDVSISEQELTTTEVSFPVTTF